ncbi:hypothetical protein H6H01_07640 [Nostoc calcicola FACHB-3891]|nr:hypothetical protein [Nostoc calcicola FACHB-3891]
MSYRIWMGTAILKLQFNLSYLLLRLIVFNFASVPLNTIKRGIPEIIKDGIKAYVKEDIAVLTSNKNNPPNNTQPEISTHQGIVPEDIFLIARPLR